jgi:hypothetical protein
MESPVEVGELLDEVGLTVVGRLVTGVVGGYMGLVGFLFFRGEEKGFAGEAVFDGVLR